MTAGRFSEKIFPGAIFHCLTVIKRIPGGNGKRARILCHCVCGNDIEVDCSNLTNNNTKSCGCWNDKQRRNNAQQRLVPGEGYSNVFPGAIFGRLTVIQRIEIDGKLTGKIHCKCSCGNEYAANIDGLIGGTSSCGCLTREKLIQRNKKNGLHSGFSSKFPKTFSRWKAMVARCCDKDNNCYKNYGEKGVVVCKFFKESPKNFKKILGIWKKEKPSVDRYPIHDGNYTCGQCKECLQNNWKLNVRWASWEEQMLNRGDYNVWITAFGKTLSSSQWIRESGLSHSTIKGRLDRGWSPEKALSTPNAIGNCYKPNF